MITASHNKYTDNGFKIADIDGKMLVQDWERYYTEISNTKDLREYIYNLINELSLTFPDFYLNNQAHICLGFDTRRSSPLLANLTQETLRLFGAKYVNYKVITTPALHFLTLSNQFVFNANYRKFIDFCKSDEYWNYLTMAFTSFYSMMDEYKFRKETIVDKVTEHVLVIDCANGIAGFLHKEIAAVISKTFNGEYIVNKLNILTNFSSLILIQHITSC